MTPASWLLLAACVLPWLALEGLFFVKMRRARSGASPALSDPGETPS
ncbi:MAG: hypothetical protein QGG40_00945 [Myxococcota bacterium]|nr:hypothetical protein [Myxococcota bacterium]